MLEGISDEIELFKRHGFLIEVRIIITIKSVSVLHISGFWQLKYSQEVITLKHAEQTARTNDLFNSL